MIVHVDNVCKFLDKAGHEVYSRQGDRPLGYSSCDRRELAVRKVGGAPMGVNRTWPCPNQSTLLEWRLRFGQDERQFRKRNKTHLDAGVAKTSLNKTVVLWIGPRKRMTTMSSWMQVTLAGMNKLTLKIFGWLMARSEE